MTKEMKNNIKMLWWCFIATMVIVGIFHCFTFNKAMEEVRQKTIEEVVLVSIDNDGYVLSFNGEEHYYSFS